MENKFQKILQSFVSENLDIKFTPQTAGLKLRYEKDGFKIDQQIAWVDLFSSEIDLVGKKIHQMHKMMEAVLSDE